MTKEMTAKAWIGLGWDALVALVPEGTAIDGVDVEQDWDAGTTTVIFPDGSRLRFDDTSVSEV